MLHRALYGSLERFLGILLEQHGKDLPAWLCPIQITVLPVGKNHEERAKEEVLRLCAHNIRAHIDARKESLSRRIAESSDQGIPWIMIIGDQELQGECVVIRNRKGAQLKQRWSTLYDDLGEEFKEP